MCGSMDDLFAQHQRFRVKCSISGSKILSSFIVHCVIDRSGKRIGAKKCAIQVNRKALKSSLNDPGLGDHEVVHGPVVAPGLHLAHPLHREHATVDATCKDNAGNEFEAVLEFLVC